MNDRTNGPPNDSQDAGSGGLAGLLSEADRTYLSAYLSQHVMAELVGLLEQAAPGVREHMVSEVRMEAEAFGDRALPVALARVVHDATTPPHVSEAKQ